MPYKDKEKQRAYDKKWISNRRLEFFRGKICKECGEDDISKLNLHHRNPESKESHKIWSWSKERREAEILKCDILCKKCHTELHAKQRRKHGTRSRYIAGCICTECKAKMAECTKRWKDNKNKKIRDMAEGESYGTNAQQVNC